MADVRNMSNYLPKCVVYVLARSASLSHGFVAVYDRCMSLFATTAVYINKIRRVMITPFFGLLLIAKTAALSWSTDIYDKNTCGLPMEGYEAYPFTEEATRQERISSVRAMRGEVPWSVFLDLSYWNNFCEGTLITRRHVLTAAHCFARKENMDECKKEDMAYPHDALDFAQAYVGGRCRHFDRDACDDEELGEKISISRVYFDEFFLYNCHGKQNLALIELEEDVPAKYHHICLPFLYDAEKLVESPHLRMTSYGYISDPGDDPDADLEVQPYLQKLDLGESMSQEECKRMSKQKPEGTFCTYGMNSVNYCKTVSGGGVTTMIDGKAYLMGVVSFGKWCKEMKHKEGPKVQIHTDIMYQSKLIDKFVRDWHNILCRD
ncbi:unnamed protein product [Cylicocyclus nassatus]|uniref:Peptidase S1 domain-containing protein n=1 Tax=Cylicocyclus nassatus TaxID=53992 RepID=A0AA36GXA2_CYLNA|nr:unnamed protein product [Cylicocyclus nassatus]